MFCITDPSLMTEKELEECFDSMEFDTNEEESLTNNLNILFDTQIIPALDAFLGPVNTPH